MDDDRVEWRSFWVGSIAGAQLLLALMILFYVIDIK